MRTKGENIITDTLIIAVNNKRITILTIYSNLFKGQQVEDVLEEFLLVLVIFINHL